MNKKLSSNTHMQRMLLSNLGATNCRMPSTSYFHHWTTRHLQKQPWSLQVVWWSAWSTVPEQWPEDHCTLSSCKPHEYQVSQQCIMPKQYKQNSVTNNKIEYNNCSRYIKQMKNPTNPRCSYGKYFPIQTLYFTRCNCHINHISQIDHNSHTGNLCSSVMLCTIDW